MRWLRILPGAALCLVALFVLVTRWAVLLANNPAYPLAIGLSLAVGIAMITTGVLASNPPRTGWVPRTLRCLGALLGVAVAAALLWARPFAATDRALDAMESNATVLVRDSRTEIQFTPERPTGAGLVLYPGARVDPRAYAVLANDIAQAGHEVVVLKCAFDIAFLCSTPEWESGDTWAVGGHSLGGVAASAFVGQEDSPASGLVLWASYPAQDLSSIIIPVASISGTKDGLATPAKVADSLADLPPSTVLTAVEGANHAYFGDYGPQGGDGRATISRADAQAQIVAATLALLDSID